MQNTIYISGLYSGPSPSAGLGVARSIRAAYPSARLIGVDYWAGSSGLHFECFDSTWLKPSWDQIEPELYAREIEAVLKDGAAWISTLDLEVAWLARTLAPHPRLLVPTRAALEPTLKPRPKIAELLPFALPESISMDAADEAIYDFCRRHSWRVWLKGPYHEAVAVTSWRHMEAARQGMAQRWSNGKLSLQANVRGYEESICFAAVDGQIADAVYMKKRITTPEGKTWAGRISDVPDDLAHAVDAAVKTLRWTGGAEIELLRDLDDRLWLMEVNPRFPAWVHGATLTGRNLPGALIGAALNLPPGQAVVASGPEFTRVVLEVATRVELPLPIPFEPDHGTLGAHGKYGASMASVVPMIEPQPIDASGKADAVLAQLSPDARLDLEDALAAVATTPARIAMPRTTKKAFAAAGALSHSQVNSGDVRLQACYSIKTCPDLDYLKLARSEGLFAECISQLEVRRALEVGWLPHEVVLNGPGKWWPATDQVVDGLAAVFCDSVEELERLVTSGRRDALWGVRLRIPGFSSRFGIAVDAPGDLARLAQLIAAFPAQRQLGVHVHMASTLIGVGHWRDAVESAVTWACALEMASGRRVQVLDLGGGFHPNDFERLPFKEIAALARASLPGLTHVYVEPGRALTQATQAMVTTVLDVRYGNKNDGSITDIVVDACIAELPLAGAYPHRLFLVTPTGKLQPLGRGATRILGRICMEDDVIAAGVDLPNNLQIGDRLVVCDAGAYDRSMSYEFGRGGY